MIRATERGEYSPYFPYNYVSIVFKSPSQEISHTPSARTRTWEPTPAESPSAVMSCRNEWNSDNGDASVGEMTDAAVVVHRRVSHFFVAFPFAFRII